MPVCGAGAEGSVAVTMPARPAGAAEHASESRRPPEAESDRASGVVGGDRGDVELGLAPGPELS